MLKVIKEELSSDKEAFLILDKLSADLKKIYDQDNYKIYEDERINKAVNDLIDLEIKFPIIKELVHYVAQSTYERKYNSEELLDKIEKVKFKYRNLNKDDDEESNENKLGENFLKRSLLEGEYEDKFDEKLKRLKQLRSSSF